MDSGSAGRNNPVLPNRIVPKPAVKTKPRSNTLSNHTAGSSEVAVDKKVKQEERSEADRNEKIQLETGTGEQQVPSSETPNETWTNDLTTTDPNSEQLRGNQVPHPSE